MSSLGLHVRLEGLASGELVRKTRIQLANTVSTADYPIEFPADHQRRALELFRIDLQQCRAQTDELVDRKRLLVRFRELSYIVLVSGRFEEVVDVAKHVPRGNVAGVEGTEF